jgi:hypothetical protein
MDFLRRTREGRVAEVLGPGPNGALTSQDALMRTIIPPHSPAPRSRRRPPVPRRSSTPLCAA